MSRSTGMAVGGASAVLVACAAALAAPGLPGSVFPGLPLSEAGTAIVVLTVAAALWLRADAMPRRWFQRALALLLVCAGVHVLTGFAGPATGWVARYFSNTAWAGVPAWSSDFRLTDATRIDEAIDFGGTSFPTHFLNDVSFERGNQREISEPLSVEWRAWFDLDGARPVTLRVEMQGLVGAAVDGVAAFDLTTSETPREVTATVPLAPGVHEVVIRYAKPAGSAGRIRASVADERGPLTPGVERGRRPAGAGVRALASAANVAVVLLAIAVCASTLARRVQSSDAPWPVMVPVIVVLGFALQGWQAAHPFASRFVTLTPGDDWFGFESRARDILQHGLLMPLGAAPGDGVPYFFHPLYCYFLAAAHALSGESLYGPVFLQHLILAAVAILMWRALEGWFGRAAALAGLVALVAVFELDFTRYYTVTLLSENLYILPVVLALLTLSRWVEQGEPSTLMRAAFWGGVASATRPPMMVFLPLALGMVVWAGWQRSRQWWAACVATAIFGGIWLLTIAPLTLRNWIVARRLVLLSDNLGSTFIKYNVPTGVDPAPYAATYGGSVLSGLFVFLRIAADHPAAFLAMQGRKLGFSLGMVHWFGGYRPHPELVAVSALYVTMLVLSSRLRQLPFWPLHLFVLSHVASMGLTQPSNYGYRLILPPFVLMTTLAAAAAWQWSTARWAFLRPMENPA